MAKNKLLHQAQQNKKNEFKLYLGSVKGVVKEYTLKLKGKDEKNYAVYFDMEEV